MKKIRKTNPAKSLKICKTRSHRLEADTGRLLAIEFNKQQNRNCEGADLEGGSYDD